MKFIHTVKELFGMDPIFKVGIDSQLNFL